MSFSSEILPYTRLCISLWDPLSEGKVSQTPIGASKVGVQWSVNNSLASLKENANTGSTAAQFELGQRYEIADGVERDDAVAKNWYLKAAAEGHVRAQYRLGLMYSQGLSVKHNFEQAVHWLRKASDQNDPLAQCCLGTMYASGRGVDQDDDEALIWYRKSAEQGCGRAEFKLGLVYANGRGVMQDDAESARWYLKAAMQGIAKAQSALAVRYATGRGVNFDEHKAVYWYMKAADQGHTMARNHLQICYREGKGVDRDLKLATYWSLKAGFKDGAIAIQMVDELESIEFIVPVLQEFPEFRNVRKLIFANPFLFTKQMAFFELFMRDNPVFTSLDFSHVSFDSSASLLEFFLQSNTTVKELLFDEEFLDKKITDKIKKSLAINFSITQLRQYFLNQLIKPTAEFPLDLVSMLIDRLIVIYLKLDHSLEKTLKAIDEFLLIVSVKQLPDESLI